MWAKIITIKRTKDLNYFRLCALNLFNTRVSQFELNQLLDTLLDKEFAINTSSQLATMCDDVTVTKWCLIS